MDSQTREHESQILIKKVSGVEEPFSTQKLERSLINAGAEGEVVEKIIIEIKEWIYSGITTKKIYARAFLLLKRHRKFTSIRYRLKQAMLELGPSGHPFEAFIGHVFKRQGFSTEVGVVVEGRSVKHEMDVIATQDNLQHLVECKHHKDQGKQVSVQVPLYVRSRINDIMNKRQALQQYQGFIFSGWVITNTRFSSDSIQYATGNDLNLLAWDYPAGNGLKDIIERLNIYPITILNELKTSEKQQLIRQGIITCKQLLEAPELLNSFSFQQKKHQGLLQDLDAICNPG